MATYPLTPNFSQLSMTVIDASIPQKEAARRKKKVAQTFARIHQLHDELNQQLYTHPTERPAIQSPADAFKILDYFIGALDHEELWILNLDTRNRVMNIVKLYQGSVNCSQVRIAEVFRQAVIDNSPSIILGHNHPSSDCTPSPDDVHLTREIHQVGKILGIEMLDHLVVSHGAYVSLKERGLGFS